MDFIINSIRLWTAASAGDAIPKISSKIGRMALTQRIARSFIRFMQSVRPRVAAPELAAGRQRRLHVLRRRAGMYCGGGAGTYCGAGAGTY